MAMLLPLFAWVALAPAPFAEIPFETFNHHVYIDGVIAGREVPVLVDTGAGATVICLELRKELGLEVQGNVAVSGTGDAQRQGEILRGAALELPNLRTQQSIIAAVPLSHLAPFEGRRIEAVLGVDFFARYVVQIDYADERLRLFERAGFEAPDGAIETPFTIETNRPHVNAKVVLPNGKTSEARALIDTGSTSAFTITGGFADAQGLHATLRGEPILPISAGVGGMARGREVEIPELELGGTRLRDIFGHAEVQTETSPQRSYDILIGAPILRRFTLTWDWTGRKLWWSTGPDVSAPFLRDRSGISWRAAGDKLDRVVVAAIREGSPAQKAGIKADDQIAAIEGQSVIGEPLPAVRQKMLKAKGSVALRLIRNGEELEIKLTLSE